MSRAFLDGKGKNVEKTKMEGLRLVRKKRGYSQLKVAMDLNISREALSYYENGKRCPDIALLLQLSRYFHVSVDFLITGKESPYPPFDEA